MKKIGNRGGIDPSLAAIIIIVAVAASAFLFYMVTSVEKAPEPKKSSAEVYHAMIFLGTISFDPKDEHFYVVNKSHEEGIYSTVVNRRMTSDGKPVSGLAGWDFGMITGKTLITVNHVRASIDILNKIHGKRAMVYGKLHITNGMRYCDEIFVVLPDDDTPK